MARQHGVFHFEGKLDEMVGYYRNGKFLLRRKSSLTAERVKTDPKFQNSMAAAKRFGEDAAMAGIIRNLLKPWEGNLAHATLNADLTSAVQRCPKKDPVPMEKCITNRDLSEWIPFAYKARCKITTLFPTMRAVLFNGSDLLLDLGAAVIPKQLEEKSSVSHLRLTLILSRIPLKKAEQKTGTQTVSLESPWQGCSDHFMFNVPLPLAFPDPIKTPHILMIAVQIQGAQEVNGIMYPMQSLQGLEIVAMLG